MSSIDSRGKTKVLQLKEMNEVVTFLILTSAVLHI